uniref:RING-type E3 ubiquitin transferase n=1 Tax=Strigamia maritima TaxID=126957 RepID=T1IZR0_STRMM
MKKNDETRADSERSKSKSKSAITSNSGSNVCRICFSGEEDGKLNKYCLCMGSIEHSHHACLVRWIQESGCHKCELCGFNYHLVVRSSCFWRWRCPPIQPNEHFFLAIYTVAWLTLAGSISWLAYITYGNDPLYRESELATIIYGVYGMIAVASTSIIIVETSCVVWPHLITMYRLNQQTVILPISSNYKLRRSSKHTMVPSRPPFSQIRSPVSFTNVYDHSTPHHPPPPRPVLRTPELRLLVNQSQPHTSPQVSWVRDCTVVYPYAGGEKEAAEFPFSIPSSGPLTMVTAAATSAWAMEPWPMCSDVNQDNRSSRSDSTDSFFTSVSTQSYPQEVSEGPSLPMTARTETGDQSSREHQLVDVRVHKVGTRNSFKAQRHCFSDTMLLSYRSSEEMSDYTDNKTGQEILSVNELMLTLNLMANCSGTPVSLSAKSIADQHMAVSDVANGDKFMSGVMEWLQAILYICSRRRIIRYRSKNIKLIKIFASPTPRSFHSFLSRSYRYNFALWYLKSIVKITPISSSSSPVFTSIKSGKGTIGSKCISGWCGVDSSSPSLLSLALVNNFTFSFAFIIRLLIRFAFIAPSAPGTRILLLVEPSIPSQSQNHFRFQQLLACPQTTNLRRDNRGTPNTKVHPRTKSTSSSFFGVNDKFPPKIDKDGLVETPNLLPNENEFKDGDVKPSFLKLNPEKEV